MQIKLFRSLDIYYLISNIDLGACFGMYKNGLIKLTLFMIEIAVNLSFSRIRKMAVQQLQT